MIIAMLRRRPSPTAALLVVSLVLFLIGVAGIADAATGGNFILGQPNTADAQTELTANIAGPALRVTNNGTDPAATGLVVNVASGHSPLRVNSATRVANLNADKVDGLDANALQRRVTGGCPAGQSIIVVNADGTVQCSAKAGDADLLDGYDSSAFVRGPGQVYKGAVALQPYGQGWFAVLSTSTPNLTVGYNCPANLANNGVVVLRNDSNELVNVFSDNGGTNPEYRQLNANGDRWDQAAAATGEHITFQVQGSQVTTIELFSVHRSTDCHIEVEAVVAR